MTSQDHQQPDAVRVARIGKPHGIRGEVTVEVLTDAPEKRFAPGAVFATEPAAQGPLTVASARWNKGILLLGFEETPDRNAAETLRGVRLLAETDEAEDDADAWYEHELVGLQVRVDDRIIGEVAELQTRPAQDLLLIRLQSGDEALVPFVEQIVPEVSTEQGFLRLTPPEGLLDLGD
ncbi:ribosome maturation factor RimM [Acaricomes phytoseiuli]|uniref:ribosome maturation factor RimM n=1 Tax=Acaricomes phytoseiuli TaxID=291968 RepID=UPI00035EA9EA|nr:ribosome maturation factor RimM [Acaricomes phytoseiuli]MCW1250441.1 ribosome maturation factor RimM [Acaricomes phytoseiuli]